MDDTRRSRFWHFVLNACIASSKPSTLDIIQTRSYEFISCDESAFLRRRDAPQILFRFRSFCSGKLKNSRIDLGACSDSEVALVEYSNWYYVCRSVSSIFSLFHALPFENDNLFTRLLWQNHFFCLLFCLEEVFHSFSSPLPLNVSRLFYFFCPSPSSSLFVSLFDAFNGSWTKVMKRETRMELLRMYFKRVKNHRTIALCEDHYQWLLLSVGVCVCGVCRMCVCRYLFSWIQKYAA